jgi:hypothetical protein
MKISKIKSALTKANNAETYYTRIMNELLIECQHCCNFELVFCEYQSGDGFCLGYETDDYDNNLISVSTFINLVAKHKRKLELKDVIKTF